MTRRELLCRSGMGMGALALGGLMAEAGLLGRAARGGDGVADPSAVRRSIAVNPAPAQGRRRCRRGPSGSSTCS